MQGDKRSHRRVLKVIYMHTSAGGKDSANMTTISKFDKALTGGRSVLLQTRASRPQLSP